MNLRDKDFEDMLALVRHIGEKDFRAKQVFQWIHAKEIHDLQDAHNLSKALKSKLVDLGAQIDVPDLLQRRISQDGTEKYLLRLKDGALIEAVLMKYRGDYSKQRNTLCVSSQVGCRMGCRFCATGQLGFERQLTPGEIVSQVYLANEILREEGEDMLVRNIVFMGMGEPLDNMDAVLKAVDILCHPLGANMSRRRMTLSTCGLADQIRALGAQEKDLGLAISLHAGRDQVRSDLMPINKRYPLHDLMAACRDYQKHTGKRISFEYALIAGKNDSDQDAKDLQTLLKGIDGHLNIIPINAVDHQQEMARPDPRACRAFVKKLNDLGLPASIRQEKGGDIEAACGQLKALYVDEDGENVCQ